MRREIGFSQVEPRCKICRSPHRREIDAMLVTGWTQSEVRQHWNEFLRQDLFSANNLSTHANRHLNPRDLALSPIRQRCVQLLLNDASQDDPIAIPVSEQIRSSLQMLYSFGVFAVNAGLVEVEPADMIRAIQLHEQLTEFAIAGERAALEQQREELTREFRLFSEAVKAFVSEAEWGALYEKFEQLLDEAGADDPQAGDPGATKRD